MSTALTIRSEDMTQDQLDLLKRTIAKGTTNDEFALFVNTSRRLGLDPFARQVFAVKRWDGKEKREVMTVQVSIDGFRMTAARTGDLDGQEGPFWCGDDGIWHEVWLHDVPPAAAKVVVYRKGCSRPFVGIATYRSYVQTKKEGGPNAMWHRFPDTMLAKCAEALGLRKAFPELSGVYTPEEMGQADNRPEGKRPGSMEPEAVDAEVVPPTDDGDLEKSLAAIATAPSTDALKALGAVLAGMPFSEAGKIKLNAAYKARMSLLRTLEDKAKREADAKASDDAMAARDAEGAA